MAEMITNNDLLDGARAEAWMNVDGTQRYLAKLMSASATVDINSFTYRPLGSLGEKNKFRGFSGSGDATFVFDPELVRIVQEYCKTGKFPDIKIVGSNKDDNGNIVHTVALYQVVFSSIDILQIDTGADYLEQSLSYTFDTWETL